MAVRMIHKWSTLTHTKTRSKTHTKRLNTKAQIPLQRYVEKEKMRMSFADWEEKVFFIVLYILCLLQRIHFYIHVCHCTCLCFYVLLCFSQCLLLIFSFHVTYSSLKYFYIVCIVYHLIFKHTNCDIKFVKMRTYT